MKKKFWMVGVGAALGLLPWLFTSVLGGGLGWTELSQPLVWAGAGLRALALEGFWGNLAAWAVALAVCALPLTALLLLPKDKRGAEDALLGLMAPVLFALVFYAVNPTLLVWGASYIFPLAAVGTLVSMGAAWVILKLLRRLDRAEEGSLSRALEFLLVGCAVLLAFGTVWGQGAWVAGQWEKTLEGNSGPVDLTLFILAALGVLRAAPGLLGALSMVWGSALAGTLGEPSFGQEGVELCRRTAEVCRTAGQASVVLCVFANLLQLALLEQLRTTDFSVTLPLFTLVLTAGLFLLCRCLQRGWELQEDSNSII